MGQNENEGSVAGNMGAQPYMVVVSHHILHEEERIKNAQTSI